MANKEQFTKVENLIGNDLVMVHTALTFIELPCKSSTANLINKRVKSIKALPFCCTTKYLQKNLSQYGGTCGVGFNIISKFWHTKN